MALNSGTRLGAYEIVAAIGVGGMGEVYRARDTRLGREVAIKVVLEAFLADRDRQIRFEREAKSLAALNHPNIATLLGMEEAGGRHFLVMELVEGETLAERLARARALSIDDTLHIARQIAEALEAAHEKGIVHRDLKPANVKITPDDKVKVLDFGLAKAAEPDPASSISMSLANSPTVSAMATQAGIILGTASYMSPEQARGMVADHRADIFSFGVVLYEMLTGRQPFLGETVSDVLASVLAREPDLGSLPPDLAPRLSELLRRCLEKQPKRRWQAIGDVRHELEVISGAPRQVPATLTTAAAAPPQPWWRRAMPIAAAVVVTAAAVGGMMSLARPVEPARVVSRFTVPWPEGQERTLSNRTGLAISPDGARIVYVASREIYVRSMDSLEARLLMRPGATPENSNPSSPVFSPDGKSVAYYEGAGEPRIMRVDVAGGAPVTVCSNTGGAGVLAWNGDAIVYTVPGGIMRVSASGGQPDRIIQLEPDERVARIQMLGDGRLLFAVAPIVSDAVVDPWTAARIVVQRPGEKTRATVVEGGSDPQYLPSGHLIYLSGGVMYARTFDPSRMKLGGAVPVVEGILHTAVGAISWYAASDTGTLVYVPGPVGTANSTTLTIALFDQAGKADPLGIPAGPYSEPRMSPDGRHIVFGYSDKLDTSIWVYDLAVTGASARRLSFGGHDRFPVWSSDSQRVIFQSDRDGDLGLFWQRVDGVGAAERLTPADKSAGFVAQSASPDGKVLLVDQTKGTEKSLLTFSFTDKSMRPFGGVVSTSPTGAVFSPDGRWVAYSVRETSLDHNTVYVQPFPSTGSKVQISTNAEDGHHQAWSPDGKTLYYTPRAGNRMVAITVMATQGFAFGPAPPVTRLFVNLSPSFERTYDVAHDGKRFLGLTTASAAITGLQRPELRVVLNWFDELKARAPIKQ